MKHNPDDTTQYKAHLIIIRYEQMNFGATYVAGGELTTFRNLISHVEKNGWNIDHLPIVTTLLNPEVNKNNIYMTLPKAWLEGLKAPTIII